MTSSGVDSCSSGIYSSYMKMEDIAFSDWPGQPVDLTTASNPWLPAYGFQTPSALLERDDFIGNPDADYFLQGAGHYMYLETIQEETSDDLRSESDFSSRGSPVGWLATDSETGSVICADLPDEVDCESDRELACPAKRRRQENILSTPILGNSSEDEYQSLSRSSSLLQFETLEKECQETLTSSSPSLFSQFSYDSLDSTTNSTNRKHNNLSPDSLDSNRRLSLLQSDNEQELDYYKSLTIDIPRKKKKLLFTSNNSGSESTSSNSSDSDGTLEASRSLDNLKTWRSFDSLPIIITNCSSIIKTGNNNSNNKSKEKVSAENLSEDSGYSDHLCGKSTSLNKLDKVLEDTQQQDGDIINRIEMTNRVKPDHFRFSRNHNIRKSFEFAAYDGDIEVYNNFTGNFGTSYHDLTIVEQLESHRSPLIDRFIKNKNKNRTTNLLLKDSSAATKVREINIAKSSSKFKSVSASEPNLTLTHHTDFSAGFRDDYDKQQCVVQSYYLLQKSTEDEANFCVSSVPKDLNLAKSDSWQFSSTNFQTVATKNFDLADLTDSDDTISDGFLKDVINKTNEQFDNFNRETSFISSKTIMKSFKREGSYAEAMGNRVDLSDDESSLRYTGTKKKTKLKSTIEEFDKNILKAISEASLQSLHNSQLLHGSNSNFDNLLMYDDSDTFSTSTPIQQNGDNNVKLRKNYVKSTPNLSFYPNNNDYLVENNHHVRKSSLVNRSTSTSIVSDAEDNNKISYSEIKSFSGSTSSKGVHFSPVVDELNWRDGSFSTPERESSYSLNSSPEIHTPPPIVVRPQARKKEMSISQPDLSSEDAAKREFAHSLKELRTCDLSKSQPEFGNKGGGLKRRGSQLMKKDKDGCLIKAYVDGDGIQYQHTHLELDTVYKSPTASSHVVGESSSAARVNINNTNSNSKNNDSAGVALNSGKRSLNNSGMETEGTPRKDKRGAGKLGGFFQRLASFRFSARKGAEEKAKLKKKNPESVQQVVQLSPHQRVATKADYIYIPLKGPENTTNNINNNNNRSSSVQQQVNNNVNNKVEQNSSAFVSGKPPLPRVVSASVKRGGDGVVAHHQGVVAYDVHSGERQRRRTIDLVGPKPMEEPMGLIETDLDTEVTVITSGQHNSKTRSLLDLGEPRVRGLTTLVASGEAHPRPHKSMEFLLDKQNLKVVEPPENELQKGERVMSEHQLRVQRSLQKLTIPDWYKSNQVPREGFLLNKKHSSRETRWTGTGSKTTSLSSLGSCTQSPIILSPTPQTQPFVRWSTSKLNSTASSPCASTRSSFNARQNGSISPSSVRSSFSYRQPYLGWRSQERLSRPRTPAERLANSLLSSSSNHHPPPHQPQESPEIQTSIKEVTSAIVHYVSGLRPDNNNRDRSYDSQETASQRSSSVSPRGSQKLCWLESSFVGTRPLDSPQTPLTLSESQTSTPAPPTTLRLDLQTPNDVKLLNAKSGDGKPSPSSTTLEDVLDSLLGLPSSARAPSPSLQETASASTSPSRLGSHSKVAEQFRRRSEGSEPANAPASSSRRVSFHSSPVLRCRFSHCGKTAFAASKEGLMYKNCHNCTYVYCSRTCRRAHWEKHRKTCLFSRIGTLCRQVIAACKEQKDTLLHLSQIARRGYLSHGLGAVKCFFPCAEAAEKFLSGGLNSLGELTYVRWQDLLPSEMGSQLYAELVKMCKCYNPDSKLVLYISVCVISEVPTSGSAKWERQLVSRCAKMRLSKLVPIPEKDLDNPETLILTSKPIPKSNNFVKEMREHCVNSVHKHLKERGVSLKRHYPPIYKQLQIYSEEVREKFTPVTVHPTDLSTGKKFMCIIMLEADDESLKQVEIAGVRVRTIDVARD